MPRHLDFVTTTAFALALGCSPHRDEATVPAAVEPAPSAKPSAPPVETKVEPPAPDFSDIERALSSLREAPQVESSLNSHVAPIPKAKGDVQEIYKKVAPATVVVRSQHGFGSGVVIDPAGFVLTNHHVAQGGDSQDFRVRVWVQLGELKDGVMEKSGPELEAYVHKWDPLIDLAVVKIVNPPANLPSIKVSRTDPSPGEAVSAIGHGGIGLLWAIKDGEISSIGKLATHLAMVAGSGGPCQVGADPASASECALSRIMTDMVKKDLATRVPALVIQSSCPISPGDSGGPLVNRAGDLVGLNAFLYSDASAPVATNFHIHVSEIRKFLSEVPAEPATLIPDPWRDGGRNPQLVDADLDGQVDTLLLTDTGRAATFIDLDQKSIANPSDFRAAADAVAKRKFHAQVVVLQMPTQTLVWYDRHDAGRFDRLLVAGEATSPVAQKVYDIDANGKVTAISQTGPVPLIDESAFPEGPRRQRLHRIAEAAFPDWVAPSSGAAAVPDPLWGGGRIAVPVDTDHDGKFDTLVTRSPFSTGIIVNADETTLGNLSPTDVTKALDARAVGAQFAAVIQGSRIWTFTDTDGDGRLDLALFSPRLSSGVATEAWKLVDDKPTDALPLYVGQKMIRPGLVGKSASRLRAAAARLLPAALLSANDSTIGAFPSPLADVNGDVDFIETGLAGWTDAVASVVGRDAESVLIDLGRDTFKKKSVARGKAAELVREGKFRAPFAWIDRSGMEWTFYDTDNDGKFDLVLFSARPASGQIDRAFRIDSKGRIKEDAAAIPGPLVRPSVFPKHLAEALRTVAPKVFQPSLIEAVHIGMQTEKRLGTSERQGRRGTR
jgi:S1-C subfamily serine protease